MSTESIMGLKYHKPRYSREELDWFSLWGFWSSTSLGSQGSSCHLGSTALVRLLFPADPKPEPIHTRGTGRAELYTAGDIDGAGCQMPGQWVSRGGKGLILQSALAEVTLALSRSPMFCWTGPQRGTVCIYKCCAAAGPDQQLKAGGKKALKIWGEGGPTENRESLSWSTN